MSKATFGPSRLVLWILNLSTTSNRQPPVLTRIGMLVTNPIHWLGVSQGFSRVQYDFHHHAFRWMQVTCPAWVPYAWPRATFAAALFIPCSAASWEITMQCRALGNPWRCWRWQCLDGTSVSCLEVKLKFFWDNFKKKGGMKILDRFEGFFFFLYCLFLV